MVVSFFGNDVFFLHDKNSTNVTKAQDAAGKLQENHIFCKRCANSSKFDQTRKRRSKIGKLRGNLRNNSQFMQKCYCIIAGNAV